VVAPTEAPLLLTLLIATACTPQLDSGSPDPGVDLVQSCDHPASGVPEASFDIEYYDPDGEGIVPPMLVDVWSPDPAVFSGQRPGLVLIHGGCGGSGGDTGGGCRSTFGSESGDREGAFFAGQGYLAVAVQYRYGQNFYEGDDEVPEADLARLPAPVQDLRCAIRWMRASEEAGLDRLDDQQLLAYGGSGGGYFSLDLLAEGARGVDTGWWDNPLCPFNEAASAALQGAVLGFPRVDDRPSYLDLTPVTDWPPVDPDDWATADGDPARSNCWSDQLKTTLDNMFGASDFSSLYGVVAEVTERVDAMAVIPKVSSDWGPLFIAHSVWDDLNYYQGTLDLRAALLDAGYPEDRLTLVPVSRAECTPPYPSDAATAIWDTDHCSGHDALFDIDSWEVDDPDDGGDLNDDGEPDWDPHTGFCTMMRFLEMRFPAGS